MGRPTGQCPTGAKTEGPKGLRERNMSIYIVPEISSDESQKSIFWCKKPGFQWSIYFGAKNLDFNGPFISMVQFISQGRRLASLIYISVITYSFSTDENCLIQTNDMTTRTLASHHIFSKLAELYQSKHHLPNESQSWSHIV